jgi:hypothetical protein
MFQGFRNPLILQPLRVVTIRPQPTRRGHSQSAYAASHWLWVANESEQR